eukprot:CAMPEP_0181391366 /NCGR_PEP_ID=MMETSP1106-20121128/25996_1 /TAXON_ID=81844 /ORGANISM="Mantoniella antarctica, Strain SL-175" /LENGTH=122 /DNA_ID=CAMNT_0023512371 /DNA_START=566 /DNA_END=931 /DNA_ORIENTATION=-
MMMKSVPELGAASVYSCERPRRDASVTAAANSALTTRLRVAYCACLGCLLCRGGAGAELLPSGLATSPMLPQPETATSTPTPPSRSRAGNPQTYFRPQCSCSDPAFVFRPLDTWIFQSGSAP